MQKNLPQLIKESSEYLDLQNQLENIKKRCENYEIDINKTEQINNELKNELENYESKQIELQKRFGNYEEYISNLQRMLTYTRTRNDFEHAILRLTTEQKEAVNRIKFQKDYLIRGAAGTGKSFVLLKTVEKLLEETKEEEYYAKPFVQTLFFKINELSSHRFCLQSVCYQTCFVNFIRSFVVQPLMNPFTIEELYKFPETFSQFLCA